MSTVVFRLLIAVVVLAPLPFGAVYSWGWGTMACAVAILVLAWSGNTIVGRGQPLPGLRRIWPSALLFALVLGWAAIQTASVTPKDWHHPLWTEAAIALGHDLAGSISVDRAATWDGIARLGCYAAIFWLAFHFGRDRAKARLGVIVFAAAASLYGAYGLANHIAGIEKILWLDKSAYRGDLTGTFINKNAFAAYLGLGLITLTGLTIDRARASNTAAGLTNGFLDAFAGIRGIDVLGWLILGSALLFAHSRGALASTAIGVMVLIASLAIGRDTRRGALRLGLFSALAAGTLFAVAGDQTDQLLAKAASQHGERLQVYNLTIDAIGATPLTGTGLGTFPEIFRLVRPDGFENFYLRAHNSYLESALELGIPAALALYISLGLLCLMLAKGVRTREIDAVYPAIALAATAHLAAHAMIDFSAQIPAVAAGWAFLLGLGCAQSWSSQAPLDDW